MVWGFKSPFGHRVGMRYIAGLVLLLLLLGCLGCQESDSNDTTPLSSVQGRFLWAVQKATAIESNNMRISPFVVAAATPKQFFAEAAPVSFAAERRIYWVYEFSVNPWQDLLGNKVLETREPLFFANLFSLLQTRVVPVLEKQEQLALHFSTERPPILRSRLPDNLPAGNYRIHVGYQRQSIDQAEFTIRQTRATPVVPADDSF